MRGRFLRAGKVYDGTGRVDVSVLFAELSRLGIKHVAITVGRRTIIEANQPREIVIPLWHEIVSLVVRKPH